MKSEIDAILDLMEQLLCQFSFEWTAEAAAK